MLKIILKLFEWWYRVKYKFTRLKQTCVVKLLKANIISTTLWKGHFYITLCSPPQTVGRHIVFGSVVVCVVCVIVVVCMIPCGHDNF